MGSNKYLVRMIVEEVKVVNGTIEEYRGEVHGEDLMTYDDLSVAREAVGSYAHVIADYVSACKSIADDPVATDGGTSMDKEHTFEFRYEVRVQYVKILVDLNGMPIGEESQIDVYTFPQYSNAHRLWNAVILPHTVLTVKGGVVVDKESSHPNQIFTVIDLDGG